MQDTTTLSMTSRIPVKQTEHHAGSQPASNTQPHTSPRARGRQPRSGQAELTKREREIALHITLGESNQAIAEILALARRTVETHISNIMCKLGYTSRTQIAVWAVKAGLTNTTS